MSVRGSLSFSEVLRNIFFIIIILQIAPPMIHSLIKYYKYLLEARTQVGVITVAGTLYDSSSIVKKFEKFFLNKDIKAILVKMECPGTASGTAQTIFEDIRVLKKDNPKPVIVLVENVCASGGYYIACAADHIVSPGSALIGSIGTTLPYLFNVKGVLEQFKVKYTPIAAGEFKNVANPFVDMSPKETELLQSVVNDSYDQFINDVSVARNLPLASATQWADGKVFTARQALKLGLIDELGGFEQATIALRKKAMFEGKIEWVYPPSKMSIWNFFTGKQENDGQDSFFSSAINRICSCLEQRYNRQTLS